MKKHYSLGISLINFLLHIKNNNILINIHILIKDFIVPVKILQKHSKKFLIIKLLNLLKINLFIKLVFRKILTIYNIKISLTVLLKRIIKIKRCKSLLIPVIMNLQKENFSRLKLKEKIWQELFHFLILLLIKNNHKINSLIRLFTRELFNNVIMVIFVLFNLQSQEPMLEKQRIWPALLKLHKLVYKLLLKLL